MNEQEYAPSATWLVSHLALIPLATLVRSAEFALAVTQALQKLTRQSLEFVIGTSARNHGLPAPGSVSVASACCGRAADFANDDTNNVQPAPKSKEEIHLAPIDNSPTGLDKDLRDDMLKLVRYKVLFVRREFEVAFREREDLVSDNLDASAFTAWKIAEFIQDLQKGTTTVPQKWRDRNYPPKGFSDGDALTGIPHEDKKYLRVYYEVLERYPREKFKYEEEQIKVLEDIRDTLERRSLKEPGDNGGSEGAAGS
jgi:hypothetical protein